MPIIYFTNVEEVIETHRKTVVVSGGGADGILNIGSIECALEQIQNDVYYPTFEEKLTHLFFVANKSHCFQDGNKRIAISLGAMFLLKNGYLYAASDFLFKMETISYHVAANNIDKPLLQEIITSLLNEDDYDEELKLKIAKAILNHNIEDNL